MATTATVYRLFDYFDGIHLNTLFIKNDETIFKKIDDLLATNAYVFLYGVSGCGKTTLAREFAYHKKHLLNNAITIQFLDCSGSFETNLQKMKARFLANESGGGGNGVEGNQIIKVEETLQAIKSRINNYETDILLIFDNVQNSCDIVKFLFDINTKHKIIITSTNHQLFMNCGIEVELFSERACFEYLDRTQTKHALNPEEWKELLMGDRCRQIQILPKTLELLTSNLNNHMLWRFKELKQFLKIDSNARYELMRKNCEMAYEILKNLAYLNGRSIDFELIKRLFSKQLSDSAARFEEALVYLLKNTYIKKKYEPNVIETAFEVHDTIKNEIQRILDGGTDNSDREEEKNKILMNITRVLNSLANEQGITDYKKLNIDKLMKLNEHFLELNKHISVDCCSWVKHIEHRYFVELLEKMSKINRKIFFNYENSKMIYLKLLSIYKSYDRFKDNVRLITETLDSIAKMYQYMNNYDEALKYLFESLEIQRKKASNENDLKIAEMLNNIGYVYDYMKKHTEALKYYEDSLKIYTTSAKKDYNAISTVLNNIGSVHVAMENNEKALEFYKKATEKFKKIPDNPDNGVLLHNLGFMHYKQGNFVDALKCYTESLEIKKKKLLPNDPLISSTLEYLGNVHYDKNEFEKALNFYKESLKIKRQTSTSNHSNIEILHRRISSIEAITTPLDPNNEEFDSIIIGQTFNKIYNVESKIGHGGFAHVYLVNDLNQNIKRAMKVVSMSEFNNRSFFWKEIEVLLKIESPYIIKYFDNFKIRDFLSAIIIEYCENGDLALRIKMTKDRNENICNKQIFSWTIQITLALKILHSKNIIHRDITPSNIFLSIDDRIKLGDLGCARNNESEKFVSTWIGKRHYVSPEMNNYEYTYTTDIWSLGCVLFELKNLEIAYPNGAATENFKKPDLQNSHPFSSLLEKMFDLNWKERIGAEKLYDHLMEMKSDNEIFKNVEID